ncbi:hypothetical protein N0V90_011576 [Kalmusia sp. IMI 367209]|nr:hypothetical protein N0V90_011576 [Kalmusia sp. IMI 367209]
MRFSKKKALLACARALPALAAVLPSEGSRSGVAQSQPQPRPEGKELLELEWNGDFASGSASFSGVPDIQENAWFLQHDLDLEWESACLHGEQDADDAAQVLTVNIKSIDGKTLDTPSGFTLSFKQVSPPELLRLEATPDRSASAKEHAESWRQPPAHLRLVVPKKNQSLKTTENTSQSQLEDDIRELRALESEVQKLQKAIAEKKKFIDSQVKKEAQSFKEELHQCKNFTCVIKTIANGAHGAWRVIYVRFRPNHHHHHHSPPPMGRPEDEYHRVWRAGNHKQGNIRIDLRTRTERAASREERLTQRAYRRAARKYAWRKWWRGNWRDQVRIEDYEEKRSLIQHQEGILEEVMQEEIRQLRAAHGVVNDIVSQAEEGRVYPHNYCHCAHPVPQAPYSPLSTASTYPPTSLPELPSRPLSRTDSLPGYRSDASSEPPAYEEDEDMSDTVANGFRHYSSTVSTTSSQWTPESSIIDVSPRPSAETLRYTEAASEFAETTETGVGEKN